MKDSKILIKINNCYSYIEGLLNPYIEKQVIEAMEYKQEGAENSKLYEKGIWDGKVRLYKTGTKSFPTGLVPILVEIFNRTGVSYEIQDLRVEPSKEHFFEIDTNFDNRDYQLDTVKTIASSSRGVVEIATGGGKNYIMMLAARELGVKTLIIVNTKEALDDTYNTAIKCFPKEKVGIFGGKNSSIGEFLTIATMKKITSKKKGGNSSIDFIVSQGFKALFIDEAHHLGKTLWSDTALSIDAYYRYAFTATAFRTDNADMYIRATTGKVLVRISARDLIYKGYLVDPKIIFHVINIQGFAFPMQYQDVYTGGIVRNKYRNDKIEEIIKSNLGKSILIIFDKLDHGDILYERIKKIDPNCKLIHGKTKNREELKKLFTTGEVKTVIASRIYNESADVPIIEVLVNTAGGKSGIQVIQRIGRSLRLHSGKEKAVIHDFYDRFNPKLEEHSAIRLRWIKSEKFEYELEGDLESNFVFGSSVGEVYKDEEEK